MFENQSYLQSRSSLLCPGRVCKGVVKQKECGRWGVGLKKASGHRMVTMADLFKMVLVWFTHLDIRERVLS